MVRRRKVSFESAGVRCVAWHYQDDNAACIVMAAGLGVPKDPGTSLLAERFNRAGFSVLAFDYRRLGESAGKQRGLVRLGEQLTDFEAAVAHARTLPEVDQIHARWPSGASQCPAVTSTGSRHAILTSVRRSRTRVWRTGSQRRGTR